MEHSLHVFLPLLPDSHESALRSHIASLSQMDEWTSHSFLGRTSKSHTQGRRSSPDNVWAGLSFLSPDGNPSLQRSHPSICTLLANACANKHRFTHPTSCKVTLSLSLCVVVRSARSSSFLVLNATTSNNNRKIRRVLIPSTIRLLFYLIVQPPHRHRHPPVSPSGSWHHCVCHPNWSLVHSYLSLSYKSPGKALVTKDIAFQIKLKW